MPSTIIDRSSGLGIDAIANGENATISQKVPCRVATNANITLSGLRPIDAVTVVADDRVLIKEQTDASENGIYLASPDVWQRTADCVDAGDLVKGSEVRVNEGSVGAGSYYCTSEDPIVIGTDDIIWVDVATTVLTGAEIKALYEAESNTNGFTDAEQTKVGHLTVTQAVDLDQMETDIAALSDGMVYKGNWDASAGTFPGTSAAQTGWFYYVSVAGTVDSIEFAVGDNLVATTDNASTTIFAGNWSKHDQTPSIVDDVDFDTKADLEAADIAVGINLVRIAGYTSVGDGGGASYKRVGSEPPHAGKIQSADGVWWELIGTTVTPQMFGAVADGSTDDTTAIQAALDKVAGVSTVLFPAGTYKVTSTLTVSSGGIALLGEASRVTTILHSGDYGDTISFSSATPLANRIAFITIKNLRFFVDSTAALPTIGVHMHFVRPQNVELHNLNIQDHFGGIHFEGGAGVYISDLVMFGGQFYSSVQAGSYLLKFSPAATSSANEFPAEYAISNFNIKANGAAYLEDGIIVEASDGIWFSNGHVGFTALNALRVQPVNAADSLNGLNFSNVHFDGNFNTERGVNYTEVVLGFHTGACFGHTYTGCQFSICTLEGMKFGLQSVDGISITGGRCNGNGTYGMRFSRGSGFAITNVVYKDNGNNLAGSGHVLFENDASHSKIDAIFRATAYRGVQIAGTCGNIRVDGVFAGITFEDVFTSSSNANVTIGGVSDRSRTLASSAELQIPILGTEFTITGATNITSIRASATLSEGRVITLRFNSTPTVVDGGNLVLAGNFVATANDTLTLKNMNGAWLELSRSAN